jgi:hypothetical protein
MKAYVNVLILFFWIYYTNVLTRKEYWSHEYGKFTRCSNQSIG